MDGVMERLITLLNTPVSGEWKLFWIDVIVMVIVVAVIWVLPKGE